MERRNEFLNERYQFIAEPVEQLTVVDEPNEGLVSVNASTSEFVGFCAYFNN